MSFVETLKENDKVATLFYGQVWGKNYDCDEYARV